MPPIPSEIRARVRARMDAEGPAALHAELMARYQELAGTDPLTGIANRRRFLEEADREISRSHRSGEPVSLLMIDVDNFKVVNDQHGHVVGDGALTAVAKDLRAALREGDLLGRCGGDEFIALLPGCDAEQAVTVADRVQALRVRHWEPETTGPIQLNDTTLHLTATADDGAVDKLFGDDDGGSTNTKDWFWANAAQDVLTMPSGDIFK